MRIACNLLLALGSLAVGLSLCEAALRVFHPRYEYAAEPPRRAYHWSRHYRHPDTGAKHLVAYNNLGSRQHRNFNARDLTEGVSLAFFGDSFTENLRMPAHHSFTEVLDYLLNAPPPHMPGVGAGSRSRFNVLNFGRDGTGPIEQYAGYRSVALKPHPRHVFYVHMENDLREVRESFAWGGAARTLARQAEQESRAWIRALSGFHLAYLALDAWRRLDIGEGSLLVAMPESEAMAAFESVLRRWHRDVKANGGEFHVVRLPTPEGGKWLERLESPESWNVVDLHRCFNEAIPDFQYSDWRFANDRHWNEAANMVAAHCLYRRLEGLLDLPQRSDAELARTRHAYYRAFQDRFDGEAGWMPGPPWALPGPPADGEADRVVARYQALGGNDDTRRQRIINAARSREPVLRSVWDVHYDAEHRFVVYVKEPCDEPDPAAGFFLHLRLPNVELLRPSELRRGFRVLEDFQASVAVRRSPSPRGGECVLAVPLRIGQIASARTGQRAADGDTLWEGEFPVDAEDMNRIRREWRAIAETEPVARSVWNVHARRERREIALLKAPCLGTDAAGSFFVNVLPPGQRGWTSLARSELGQFATILDGRCLVTVALPDWPVGGVQVGERAPDTWALRWQAKFYWDVEGLRRARDAVSGRRPDAAGAFEVYRHDGALVYVREPCAEADVRDRFFLHAHAALSEDDANLDFDFAERGALFDGKCVALVPLPGATTRLSTGQFSSTGNTWAVELAEA